MSTPQLMVANCPRCGKVFQKNLRNQCSDCSRSLDTALNGCLDYLRKHYKSTCRQVSLETGVSTHQLYAWMKEGKLLLADYPNLSYPCETCAAPIRKHKMCPDCLVRLNRDIQALQLKERPGPYRGAALGTAGAFQISGRIGRV